MAYSQWARDGKPIIPAQPIREIVGALKAAYPAAARSNLLGWYANDAHYLAHPAEDHTPYSETGWPLTSPYPYVFATDIAHRPDLGLDCNALFAYWIGEARRGAMPWLKYLNWHGQWRCKGLLGETVGFSKAWPNSDSPDHIHMSTRTDHRDTSLGGWNPIPHAGTREEPDMTPIEAQQALINAWRLDALQTGVSVVRDGPLKGEPMWAVTAIKNQQAALDALTKAIAAMATAVGAIGTSTPEVAEILAKVQAALDVQTAALQASTAATVADLGEGGAAQVRSHA